MTIRAAVRHWRTLGLMLVAFVLLPSCTGDAFNSAAATAPGTGTGGTAPGCADDPTLPGCTTTAAYITIAASAQEVKSDGQDKIEITASVLDEDRAAIKDVQVLFTAINASNTSAGRLSSSVGFTDETGTTTIDFYASADNPANGIVYVTASVTGLGQASIPITIKGTTLTLSADNTTLIVESGSSSVQQSVVITAKDAAGRAIYNVPIAFTIAGNSAGTTAAPVGASVLPATVNTDTAGKSTVTLTGVSSGDVYFTATGLGTTVSQHFTVQNVALDNPFRITSPTPATGVSYVPMYANGSTQVVTVQGDPSQVTTVAGVKTVRFTTSIGSWTDGSNPGGSYTDVVFAAGTASATLISNTGDHGFATVYVVDANDTDTFDAVTVAMSPPVTNAAQVIVDSDVNVLPLKTTTTDYTATIEARVVTNDASGNFPIYQVPVQFILRNTTGGGEELGTTYGLTDVYGSVKTVLKSGVRSSGANAVTVDAKVLSTTATTTTLAANTTITQTTLAAVMTSTDTAITVASGVGFPTIPPNFVVVIGTEQILVSSTGAGTDWTVERGYNGSTAAAHAIADTVTYHSPALVVTDGSSFPDSNFVVTIGTEQMLVSATPNNASWTVVRGYSGTTPAQHLSGATVSYLPSITDSVNVTIGGVGGSVAIGKANHIVLDENNDAKYVTDMAAQVADSNGNAVSGSSVTLSMWPESYYTGAWYDEDLDPDTERCVPYVSGGPFTNEDVDEDLILDRPPSTFTDEDLNLDGELTPHNSTAGAIPSTVQTDATGTGAYKLTYLKQYSAWVRARARGRAKVQGTETTGTLSFVLPYLLSEADQCIMPDSPFKLSLYGVLSISSTEHANVANTGSVYVAKNLESTDYDIYGASISALEDCVYSAGPPAGCTNADVGKYIMPSSLPSTAQSLRQLYGVGYSTSIFEYQEEITVSDTFQCTTTTTGCTTWSVSFPVRVLVDCSSTPGQGGCP